ncbi:hypothetical protein PROPHIGD13-2_36 [Mycobacterium phage prophiGD13-2]|nr:hypothetical protein PROPHIGD13-2_36 [Mycobacterium phage prophiGD13-2]
MDLETDSGVFRILVEQTAACDSKHPDHASKHDGGVMSW